MPLLEREPDRFPPTLFAAEAAAPAGSLWCVLHTRPRQEKSVARHLHTRRVPFYLPLVSRRLRVRGRILTSHVPLFPGYVFLLATPEERARALPAGRIANTLPVPNQPGLWQDLRQVNRLIETGAPITPEEKLVPGDLVEIRSGPLAGLNGTIVRTASGDRFVVQVHFIQQGASVLLDRMHLEAVREVRRT
jgi:transcription antitermination factor NusG